MLEKAEAVAVAGSPKETAHPLLPAAGATRTDGVSVASRHQGARKFKVKNTCFLFVLTLSYEIRKELPLTLLLALLRRK